MDEEEKNKEEAVEAKPEKKEKKEKKAKKEKEKSSQGGAAVGLQFLTLFVVIGVICIQYMQFEKVVDIEKRLGEDGKLEEPQTELKEIPIKDQELFSVSKSGVYNVSDGSETKMFVLTVDLILNTKAKKYSKVLEALTKNLSLVKETTEKVITSSTLSDFDGREREEDIKLKIINKINKQFETDAVVDVCFSDRLIS